MCGIERGLDPAGGCPELERTGMVGAMVGFRRYRAPDAGGIRLDGEAGSTPAIAA